MKNSSSVIKCASVFASSVRLGFLFVQSRKLIWPITFAKSHVCVSHQLSYKCVFDRGVAAKPLKKKLTKKKINAEVPTTFFPQAKIKIYLTGRRDT